MYFLFNFTPKTHTHTHTGLLNLGHAVFHISLTAQTKDSYTSKNLLSVQKIISPSLKLFNHHRTFLDTIRQKNYLKKGGNLFV